MSFIYDNPWLIKQLLEAGTKSENQFSKKGQLAPLQEQKQLSDALRAALFNLRDQITPLQEGAGEVMQGSGGADLSSHNMDSMGDLVEWMAKNGTRIGGNVIVVDGKSERPSEEYGNFKIEPGTEIVTPLARPDRTAKTFWINPTALKQYLVGLQSDPKLKGNVIFQVQLLKLIQDANNQLDLDISEQYKEPAAPPLADNTPLDDVPNPVNQAGGSTVPLVFGDLKSLQTFWNWAINHKMTMKKPDGSIVNAGTDEFDQCGFISAIAARAKSLYGYRRPNSQQYLERMQAIAQEANCDISQVVPQAGPQGQGGGLQDPQVLQHLVTLLPFNSQNVNFREIQKFINTYAPLARRSDISSQTAQVNESIQAIQSLMRQPSMIVPLQQLKQIDNRMGPSYLAAYHSFAKDARMMDVLYTIVNTAGIIYTDFVNTAQHILGDRLPSEVKQQIVPGGPLSVNLSDIGDIRGMLADEAQSPRHY